MKALTLTEPWASLVACGAKYYETRSWRTAYLGALAIHAAKGFPAWARDLANCQRVRQLVGISYVYPVGCVVATCRLADCVPVESLLALSAQEEMFGNYERGRFAWFSPTCGPSLNRCQPRARSDCGNGSSPRRLRYEPPS